jgi:hypothetical protein
VPEAASAGGHGHAERSPSPQARSLRARRSKWGTLCDAPDGVLVLDSPTGRAPNPEAAESGAAGEEAAKEQEPAEDATAGLAEDEQRAEAGGLIRAWRDPGEEEAADAAGVAAGAAPGEEAGANAGAQTVKQRLKAAVSGSAEPLTKVAAPEAAGLDGLASSIEAQEGTARPASDAGLDQATGYGQLLPPPPQLSAPWRPPQQRRRSSGVGAHPEGTSPDRGHHAVAQHGQGAPQPGCTPGARPRSANGSRSSSGAGAVGGLASPARGVPRAGGAARGGLHPAGASPTVLISARELEQLQQEVAQLQQQQLSMASVLQQLTHSSTAAVTSLQGRITMLEAANQAQALAAIASLACTSPACGLPAGPDKAVLPLLQLQHLQAAGVAAAHGGWASPGGRQSGLSKSLDDWAAAVAASAPGSAGASPPRMPLLRVGVSQSLSVLPGIAVRARRG